jgi:hypothetical protein
MMLFEHDRNGIDIAVSRVKKAVCDVRKDPNNEPGDIKVQVEIWSLTMWR